MSAILQAIRKHDPARLALVGDSLKYNYGDLDREISMRAGLLGEVQVLALALDNSPDWILWDLACVRAGIPCIPIPPFFHAEQVKNALEAAGATHLLSPEGLSGTGLPFAGDLPEGTAKVTFTSGTTGAPKGVCLSQKGIEQVAQSIVSILGTDMAGRHLSILPLAVLLENVAGVYATLLAGGTVYMPSLKTIGFTDPFRPKMAELIGYMSSRRINSAILVPEILRGLVGMNPLLPDLRFLAVGGSKISPALIDAARKCHLPVYEGYGLSECGSVVSLNTPRDDRPGSVGKILPHIKLANNDGEILVVNPAFLGYVGHPRRGPLLTGDIGHLDSEGFLHISGRKKNVLITSYGRNISPEWVESILTAQPEIAQAVVYGDAQPFPGALIVPAARDADIRAAVARANDALPAYARIGNFHAIPPLTAQAGLLTATGRPRREAIFKEYKTIMTKEKDHEFLQTAG